MTRDTIKKHTEIYMGRMFLSADEISEHRKVILENFEDLNHDGKMEMIVYWLELLRDKSKAYESRNLEHELEIINHKSMVEIKTFAFKLITAFALIVGLFTIALMLKDAYPYIVSGLIKFL